MPVHSAEVLVTLQLLMVIMLILHDGNARPLTRSNYLHVGYHQHSLLSTAATKRHHLLEALDNAATPKTETIQQVPRHFNGSYNSLDF